jgi:hypothetical protein
MSVLEQVRAEARAFTEQIDASERAFCEMWLNSGPLKAKTGQLVTYAEAVGLIISGRTLEGKSLKGKQTTLGRWLASIDESPVKGEGVNYAITVAGSKDGYTLWQIKTEPIAASALNFQ